MICLLYKLILLNTRKTHLKRNLKCLPLGRGTDGRETSIFHLIPFIWFRFLACTVIFFNNIKNKKGLERGSNLLKIIHTVSDGAAF